MTITVKELKKIVAEIPDEFDDVLVYSYVGDDNDCSGYLGGVTIITESQEHYIHHCGDPAWPYEEGEDGNYHPKLPLIYI